MLFFSSAFSVFRINPPLGWLFLRLLLFYDLQKQEKNLTKGKISAQKLFHNREWKKIKKYDKDLSKFKSNSSTSVSIQSSQAGFLKKNQNKKSTYPFSLTPKE